MKQCFGRVEGWVVWFFSQICPKKFMNSSQAWWRKLCPIHSSQKICCDDFQTNCFISTSRKLGTLVGPIWRFIFFKEVVQLHRCILHTGIPVKRFHSNNALILKKEAPLSSFTFQHTRLHSSDDTWTDLTLFILERNTSPWVTGCVPFPERVHPQVHNSWPTGGEAWENF